MRFFRLFLLGFFCVGYIFSLSSVGVAKLPAQEFGIWLEEFKDWAESQGVRRDVLQEAFRGIKSPRRGSLKADRHQPESVLNFTDYYSRAVSQNRLYRAQRLSDKHAVLFSAVEEKYGIPSYYLLAFWGLESNFGDYTGKIPVIHTLATLAYDLRRREFFTKELLQALLILQNGDIGVDSMRGSWAGAMGQTQFIPSTFTAYAVDGDGDGRRDLWNNLADIFHSSGNFLSRLGWRRGESWGYQVKLSDDFDYSLSDLSVKRPLSFWRGNGVVSVSGVAVDGSDDMLASLILPVGYDGPSFLVFDNFRVIMRWNNSVLYALAVGLLADHVRDDVARPIDFGDSHSLSFVELKSMQEMLNGLGYDSGVADGILGSNTKAALRKFQRQQNLPEDGYPSRRVLKALRSL